MFQKGQAPAAMLTTDENNLSLFGFGLAEHGEVGQRDGFLNVLNIGRSGFILKEVVLLSVKAITMPSLLGSKSRKR